MGVSRLRKRCFNGHWRDKPGCAGCHHIRHVVEPGQVADGKLVAPIVIGPEDCDMCHRARHQIAVPGCPLCETKFSDVVREAMEPSMPIRSEIATLQFWHWFIGWKSWMAGWLLLLAGVGFGDWFVHSDGSTDWFQTVLALASIPVAQWAIRGMIRQKSRMLPRLNARGEIVYGEDDDPVGSERGEGDGVHRPAQGTEARRPNRWRG